MDKTILYLRPARSDTVKVLENVANKPYVYQVARTPQPSDIPIDGHEVPNFLPTIFYFPESNVRNDRGESRESTPGFYHISKSVLRLGFETVAEPSARGFEFGSRPYSDVQVPYYGDNGLDDCAYFRVHYNFNSGALLITALDKIKVGDVLLRKHQSLLLTAHTSIYCGGDHELMVEFPDISNCEKEHERNFHKYAAKVGYPDAPYLISCQEDLFQIGAEHKSKAVLGSGSNGEVHKAVHTGTGASSAIKILNGGGKKEMKEVIIMSRLYHVGLSILVPCYILTHEQKNIIKYEGAFQIDSGQICIVMELAVCDLETWTKSMHGGRHQHYPSLRCIRSIGRQALSGLHYLHGMGIMHRDIKPQNILLINCDPQAEDPTIKLADFGLAGLGSERKTLCGTIAYLAPEISGAYEKFRERQRQIAQGKKTEPPEPLLPYTNAVDIWALGLVLAELVRDAPTHIVHGGKKALVNKDVAFHLIDRMMQKDPRKRPTAAECLQDPWMAMVDTSVSRLTGNWATSPSPSASSSKA